MSELYKIRAFWANNLTNQEICEKINNGKEISEESYKVLSTMDDSLELRHYLGLKDINIDQDNRCIKDFVQVYFPRGNKDRKQLYDNGFTIKGIHYVRYKRSAGSARGGKCLFINDKILPLMMDWSRCGIDETSKKVTSNQVGYQSYIALTLSGIKGVIRISKKSILLLNDDYKSTFTDTVNSVSIEALDKMKCEASKVEVNNNIWDGEGLLDESLFNSSQYAENGMLLLRNKFFKCCVFNTKLQKWFRDNNILLGDLKKLGKTQAETIEDIKLVVTPSSLKYLKFGEFDDWLKNIDDEFGVVKYDKKSPYFDGKMVRTSYTLFNTININEDRVKELLVKPFEYNQKVRDDIDIFCYHLGRKNKTKQTSEEDNHSFRFGLLLDIIKHYPDMFNNPLLSMCKADVIDSIREDYKKGKILISGHYCTVFGNGPEMLKYLAGEKDLLPSLGKNEIYCTGFDDKKALACFRFPHVTMGNIYSVCNKYHEDFDYFNLTDEIVCVNSIDNNIMQRLSGMDFDSDTMLISDEKMIVDSTSRFYDKFLIPFNSAEESRDDTQDEETTNNYELDDTIRSANVGQVVNFATQLNSIFWDKYNNNHKLDKDLYEKICILSVLASLEIDKAKHHYNVNSFKVMNTIKKELKENGYSLDTPMFKSAFGKGKNQVSMNITMDYLYTNVDKKRLNKSHLPKKYFTELVGEYKSPNGSFNKKMNEAIAIVENVADAFINANKRQHKDAESLGYLNNYRKTVLDDNFVKISPYLQEKENIQYLCGKIDKWTKIKTGESSSKEYTKEKAVTMAWIMLYYLWNDNEDEGMLKSIIDFDIAKSHKHGLILDDDGDVELYGHNFIRKEQDMVDTDDYEDNSFDDDDLYDDKYDFYDTEY